MILTGGQGSEKIVSEYNEEGFIRYLPQLLEDMREDCDGRHSIELLDENCDEDDDDLHKILALSNPFRRIDGELFFLLL